MKILGMIKLDYGEVWPLARAVIPQESFLASKVPPHECSMILITANGEIKNVKIRAAG